MANRNLSQTQNEHRPEHNLRFIENKIRIKMFPLFFTLLNKTLSKL